MTTTLADFFIEGDASIRACYWGNRFHQSVGVGKYGELLEGAYSNDGELMYPFYEGVEWIGGMTMPHDDCFIRPTSMSSVPYPRGAFSLNPDRLGDWELVETEDDVNRIGRDSNPIKLLLIRADISGNAIIPLRDAFLTSMSYREVQNPLALYSDPIPLWNAYIYQEKGSRSTTNATQITGSARSLKQLWETWTKSATSERDFMFHYNPSDKQERNIYSYNYSKGFNNRGEFGLGDLLG